MACSFSAVGDPSRLSGSRSSQARYSSWSATSMATAAAQRFGRGRTRGAGEAAWRAWRCLARCRACRWAGVIGVVAMRRAGISTFYCAIVTSRFPTVFKPVSLFDRGTVSPSRPRPGRAPRAAQVKAGRRPPRPPARLGLDRASTAPSWQVRGSGGTAQGFLFVLVQIVHVEVAMLFEPVLVGLDRERPHQPEAALGIGEDPNHMSTALEFLVEPLRTSARKNSSSPAKSAFTSIVPDLPFRSVMVCSLPTGG